MGSPFIVLVPSFHTVTEKGPILALDCIPFPTSMASTSKGEIVVASQKRDLIILKNKEKRTVNMVHEMKGLHYLAVDSKDIVYLVSFLNQIGKLDMNSGVLNRYEVNQLKGPGHICIAVYGDEVLVTENCNANQMIVYDKSLQNRRCITGRGAQNSATFP